MRSYFETVNGFSNGAVPRNLSEAQAYCYIMMCMKDLEEWKNGCKINRKRNIYEGF